MPSKKLNRNHSGKGWSFKHTPQPHEPRRAPKRTPLEDDTLFAFVIDYIERNEGRFPTLRACADYFGTTLVAIENAVNAFDHTETRGVDLIVAYRIGGAVREIEKKSDWEVEAWSDG